MKTVDTQTLGQEGVDDQRSNSKTARKRPGLVFGVVLTLLVMHGLLLAWGALRHSPTWDEVGHLPSGVGHLRFGKFEYYRANPPLVRMVAAVPVLLFAPEMSWERYRLTITGRSEFDVGYDFIKANGEQSFWYFTLARWACIPFSLLGAYVSFRWARELYGDLAGILAITLWCFAPNMLAHGQLLTPDVGGTAMGVAAS